MEYLKPIETLQRSIERYETLVTVLSVLLGISIIAVPMLFRNGPYVVSNQNSFSTVSQSEPWKLTPARMEGFTKLYLSSRFEWAPDNFQAKLSSLKEVTSEGVFKNLKNSNSSFQSIAQNDQARSYFVFEGYGFSNKERKIEAKITRVLRIKNTAAATPFVVRLSYQETSISELNPYGLVVTGVEETVPVDSNTEGARE